MKSECSIEMKSGENGFSVHERYKIKIKYRNEIRIQERNENQEKILSKYEIRIQQKNKSKS